MDEYEDNVLGAVEHAERTGTAKETGNDNRFDWGGALENVTELGVAIFNRNKSGTPTTGHTGNANSGKVNGTLVAGILILVLVLVVAFVVIARKARK